jgi:NAD(P)-dependent dehydrogenase (short-subunit alcohol dehydrogenase family)
VAALEDALPATLDAVVNNAGVVVAGPVEAVPIAEWRRHVVGAAAKAQAVIDARCPQRCATSS